jgi:hypothetical protein
MPVVRVLVVLLLVCSASAFAQKQSDLFAGSIQAAESSKSAQVTPSEPWRIISNQPADAGSGRNPLDRLRPEENRVFQFTRDGHARVLSLDAETVSLEGEPDANTTCYAMRSYVVARDEKDSDSTHPVGSSTCQPASRYRVKKALVEPGSSDR